MNTELHMLWNELLDDLAKPAFVWQLLAIGLSLAVAWAVNGILRRYVSLQSKRDWHVAIGGINRVLFPITTLVFVSLSSWILHHFQHVSILKLASTLLIAMVAIRLLVYALRYIFAPSNWVRAMESSISATIWGLMALHLTGLLPDIILAMEETSFHIGKSKINVWQLLQAIATIFITLLLALWASRAIENRVMGAEQISVNMRVVLSKLVRIVFLFVSVLMAMSAVGLDITVLSVFGGAFGVGLGIGLQKIASNYVSGFIILMDHSLHIGDVVTIDQHYGVVSDLRTRYMVLKKLDGTEVVIPNEKLITDIVINHSATEKKSRIQMPIQVAYDTDLDVAMSLMIEAVMMQARVLRTPMPEAMIKGFGENGVDLSLNFWIADPEEGSAGLQSAVYMSIWKAFQRNAITFPFPQREIRVLNASAQPL